jgi:hypothetical protein
MLSSRYVSGYGSASRVLINQWLAEADEDSDDE